MTFDPLPDARPSERPALAPVVCEECGRAFDGVVAFVDHCFPTDRSLSMCQPKAVA